MLKIHEQMNVGHAKYVVNYHTGDGFHGDGSEFYDIKTFMSRRAKDKFVRELRKRHASPFNDPAVRSAMLASKFAHECGLPPGNLWEPPMTRHIMDAYRELGDWAMVEAQFRAQLGL